MSAYVDPRASSLSTSRSRGLRRAGHRLGHVPLLVGSVSGAEHPAMSGRPLVASASSCSQASGAPSRPARPAGSTGALPAPPQERHGVAAYLGDWHRSRRGIGRAPGRRAPSAAGPRRPGPVRGVPAGDGYVRRRREQGDGPPPVSRGRRSPCNSAPRAARPDRRARRRQPQRPLVTGRTGRNARSSGRRQRRWSGRRGSRGSAGSARTASRPTRRISAAGRRASAARTTREVRRVDGRAVAGTSSGRPAREGRPGGQLDGHSARAT